MQLKSLLLTSALVAMASAQTIKSGTNTWSKNSCQVQPTKHVIPTAGLKPTSSGPTNCPGAQTNATFGMYYGVGRNVLTNGYPIIYVFASGVQQTFNTTKGPVSVTFDESRLFMHKLLVKYIKYYIYVQCRCTSSMTPAMRQLQACFSYNSCNTAGTVNTGLIAAMQAFILNPNSPATIAPLQDYFEGLTGAFDPSGPAVLDNLRCDATSGGKDARTQGTCTLTISKGRAKAGQIASIKSTVKCPKSTCPKIGSFN